MSILSQKFKDYQFIQGNTKSVETERETMSNQDILNTLSRIEEALYYRYAGSEDREGISYQDIEAAHNAANELLKFWHRITGCTLTD